AVLLAAGPGVWAWGGALALAGLAALHVAGTAAGAVDGWFRRVKPAPALLALDARLAAEFGGRAALANEDYDRLVGYFAAGVLAYRSPGCALVHYPGVPGTRGWRSEGVEGFARVAPLLAAWVETRGDAVPLPDGTRFDAFGHLVAGLTAGSDPASPEYWGAPVDLDQRIVEAGDIAHVAWILRDRLRAAMPAVAQAALLDWLAQAAARRIYGGNWHLFPLVAGLAREAWGMPPDPATRAHYAAFRACHLGGGWFSDGPGGRVDFYNAWQMHHFLQLAAEMDPTLDPGFPEAALADFARSYVHLFAPAGFPIFGRSACYRTALPAPLVLSAGLPGDAFPAGLARRALDAAWSHFVARGAVAAGGLSQGYEGADPALLENYSGRGSCHWGLRSLTAAYRQPPGTGIWAAAPEPLPVERGAYDVAIAPAGLRVTGDPATRRVEVFVLRNAGAPDHPLERPGLARRLAEVLLRRPLRPANLAAKYGRRSYRSDRPFCR
uniref:DUF2264 domain-containing protein n=1 Tax=Falsiroseomonas oryzae TaxID=2766473 RepID=UPI0022EB6BE9